MDWRSFPSLSALRAFDATARHGGFSAAAQTLNVTHAAVAQQVRGLERHVNLRLAVRQGRGLQLTPEGLELADALSVAFEGIGQSLESLTRAAGKKALRVTTTQFLVDSRILPNLPEFWAAHPGVELSFYPSRLPVDVVKEGFDFGIQYALPNNPIGGPGVEVRKLSRVEMLSVGARSLIEKMGDDPYALPWIRHDDIEPKLVIMRAAGLDLDRLNWVDIGSPVILLTAIREGVGLSMFNQVVAEDGLKSGAFATVPTPRQAFVDYCAVIPKGPRSPIVDAFITWVTKLL